MDEVPDDQCGRTERGPRGVMLRLDLQDIVDDLSAAIGRSVDVADLEVDVIAAGAQSDIDQVRIEAILSRKTDPRVVRYALSFGIAHAVDPVRIPVNTELKTKPRLCLPLRREGRLCGYLFIIEENPINQTELDTILEAGERIAELLSRSKKESETDAARRDQLLWRALLRTPSDAVAVVEAADAEHLIPRSGVLTVAVLQGTGYAESVAYELLAAANKAFGLVGADNRLLVIVTRIEESAEDALAAALRRAAARARFPVAALGISTSETPGELRRAYARARYAAVVARFLPPHKEPTRWERLGLWSLLAGVPWTEQGVRQISPPAYRLVKESSNPTLWQTTLTYLESGQNVAVTCEKLSIHRGTLYYRFERVRAVTGQDPFDSGLNQTSLYIALLLWSTLTQLSINERELLAGSTDF
ncbi:helix-turn-helix domain-containing protein [Nocardia africana]|uniref:Helix-turn-helix domain-containing protein n=1 Tax=Nocardia africana TaxID=134964 RepID=A0ABW6NCN6_9NOCA